MDVCQTFRSHSSAPSASAVAPPAGGSNDLARDLVDTFGGPDDDEEEVVPPSAAAMPSTPPPSDGAAARVHVLALAPRFPLRNPLGFVTRPTGEPAHSNHFVAEMFTNACRRGRSGRWSSPADDGTPARLFA